MKDLNVEVKRDLEQFEINWIKKLNYTEVEVLKIYETERGNWNLILIQSKGETTPYFLSIPKIENSCSGSHYGPPEHARFYNTFVNL